MNNPDPLEMQGQIDALRIVLALVVAEMPLEKRGRLARQALENAQLFQEERVPQMAHPTYVSAFESMLRELA